MKRAIVAVVALVAVGCTAATTSEPVLEAGLDVASTESISVFKHREVECLLFYGYKAGGLDCEPWPGAWRGEPAPAGKRP